MKEIATTIIIFLSSIMAIYAQRPFWSRNAYNMTPEKMVRRLDKDVQLNDRQERQLYPIFSDYLGLLKSGKYIMTEEALHTRKMEYYQRVCAILTYEQRKKWKSTRQHEQFIGKKCYPPRTRNAKLQKMKTQRKAGLLQNK